MGCKTATGIDNAVTGQAERRRYCGQYMSDHAREVGVSGQSGDVPVCEHSPEWYLADDIIDFGFQLLRIYSVHNPKIR